MKGYHRVIVTLTFLQKHTFIKGGNILNNTWNSKTPAKTSPEWFIMVLELNPTGYIKPIFICMIAITEFARAFQ